MRLDSKRCVLDPETREVLREGTVVPFSPKASLLLKFLFENRPRAFSKARTQQHLWSETFVSEANLGNPASTVEKRSNW